MVNRLRAKSSKLASAASATRSPISKDATLHRGRRRRQEKRERHVAKQNFIQEELERLEAANKSKKRNTQPKRRAKIGPALSILTPLQDALPAENAADSDGERDRGAKHGAVRHRARRRLVQDETVQVNSVRAFDGFVQNPVEALRQHLMNTVSSDPCEIAPAIGEVREKAAKAGAERMRVEIGKKGLEDVRREARERVREKVAEKKRFAEAAAAIKKKRNGVKIEKQRFGGTARGRIGVKRTKI